MRLQKETANGMNTVMQAGHLQVIDGDGCSVTAEVSGITDTGTVVTYKVTLTAQEIETLARGIEK